MMEFSMDSAEDQLKSVSTIKKLTKDPLLCIMCVQLNVRRAGVRNEGLAQPVRPATVRQTVTCMSCQQHLFFISSTKHQFLKGDTTVQSTQLGKCFLMN